jgi:hypothetical protein
VTEQLIAVLALLFVGLTVWEWIAFWRLDSRATRTMMPVFREGVDPEVWTLLWSGDPYGYRTRRIADAELLVRPVSRFEPGPSAAPFLCALAKVIGPKGAAELTAYLPISPLLLAALVVLASLAGGIGGAIWGLLILGVGVFSWLMQMNEVRLCFKRLKRLAVDGPPLPLARSERPERPDNDKMQQTRHG